MNSIGQVRIAWALGLALVLATPGAGAELLLPFGADWVDGPVQRAERLGPKEIPYRLEGWWRVSLCVKEGLHRGHAWIRFENVHTGMVHTIGRFKDGVRGVRHRATREWLYDPITVSGLYWDHDIRYEHEVRQGEYLQGTVLLEHPWVYRGDNVFGHGVIRNNCVTYARDAWKFYSGQELDLSWIHTPERLLKSATDRKP